MIPKTGTYVKSYDGQTKWIYFLIRDDDFSKKYNTIWGKVSTDIKKEFASKPGNKNIFLKAKTKSHGNEVADFYNREIPKVDSKRTCLSVISLESALKKYENIICKYLKKNCKYISKIVIRNIIDDLESYSENFDEEQIEDIRLIIF